MYRCFCFGVQGAGGGEGHPGSGLRRGSSHRVECSAAVSGVSGGGRDGRERGGRVRGRGGERDWQRGRKGGRGRGVYRGGESCRGGIGVIVVVLVLVLAVVVIVVCGR